MPNPDEEREEELALLAALMLKFKGDSEKLARALRDGTITLAAWLAGMRLLIKRLHTSAALIAGEVDAAAVTARIQEQYEYLDGFAAAIQAGEEEEDGGLSVAAIIARAALYAGAAWATFWTAVQARETEAKEVRWNLTPAEHCDDCLELDARGWMPIEELGGQVPGDGQTACRTNCKCFLEYR